MSETSKEKRLMLQPAHAATLRQEYLNEKVKKTLDALLADLSDKMISAPTLQNNFALETNVYVYPWAREALEHEISQAFQSSWTVSITVNDVSEDYLRNDSQAHRKYRVALKLSNKTRLGGPYRSSFGL